MSGYALLVCQLNIKKFSELLATSLDEAQRKMLTTLLAEEQSKEVVERAAEARDRSRRTPVSGPNQADTPAPG